MRIFLPLIIFLLFVISCTEHAVDPPLKVSITTDSPSAIYETWAVITIKNEASSNAYLTHNSSRISFWKLEKASEDRWIDVSIDTSFCRSLSTIEKVKLASGDKLVDSVLILKAGRYRMGFPFSWDENETERDEISPEEFIVE